MKVKKCGLLFLCLLLLLPWSICSAQMTKDQQEQLSKLKQVLLLQQTELKSLQQELEELRKPSTELREQLTEAQVQLKIARNELNSANSSLVAASNEIKKLSTLSEELKEQINKEKHRNRLRQAQHTLWGFLAGCLYANIQK